MPPTPYSKTINSLEKLLRDLRKLEDSYKSIYDRYGGDIKEAHKHIREALNDKDQKIIKEILGETEKEIKANGEFDFLQSRFKEIMNEFNAGTIPLVNFKDKE